MSLLERWQIALDQLCADGRHRSLKLPAGVDFSSNDYLGYSKRHVPLAAGGRSGTASRLLRGHHPIWDEVEARLAGWHGVETALMMTSGYVANEGLLSTIIETGDVVFSDQCNHASIIDGLRLSRAEKVVFAHNNVNELEKSMRQRHTTRRAKEAWFIVTESLFGMEGDTAPLSALAELAERFQAYLIVDEAHATGCFGSTGSGLVDAARLRTRVLATVHTGGKALAVPGAYVACSHQLKELLVNRCRHLIYTTALPPQIGAWWLETLNCVASDEKSRTALKSRSGFLRSEVERRGIRMGGDHHVGAIILGSDAAAIGAAERLQTAGFDVRAIRPPTVPIGAARLRISMHADHTDEELAQLATSLQATLVLEPDTREAR